MTEPVLDGPAINSFNQAIDRLRCERAATLGRKYEPRLWELPAQLAQGPDLVTTQRMNARLAVLGSADMQRGRAAKFDLRPFKIANLGRPRLRFR